MDSSQSLTLNDQRHEGDVVCPALKDSPTVDEARLSEPVRDLDTGRNSSDQGIGIAREGSDFSARLPGVQSFLSKSSPTAEEARFGKSVSNFSAGSPAVEPLTHASSRRASLNNQSATDRSSNGKQNFRSIARFFMTGLIAAMIGVAASSAWESYGDKAKRMVRTWAPLTWSAWQSHSDEARRMMESWASSLDSLLSVLTTKSLPGVDVVAKQNRSTPSGRMSAQDVLPQSGSITQKPAQAAAAVTPELTQQLEAITRDLAAMRRRVDQLAATQEQMTHSIASLQAVEQDIKQKISSPPLLPAAPLPPPKNGPSIATSQPPARVSILADWSIRDSRDGYIFVQGHGKVYPVAPGAPLPGLGPVERIKRQDGRWVVVTPKGIIVSSRDRHYFEQR
jgi:hypothetical protein